MNTYLGQNNQAIQSQKQVQTNCSAQHQNPADLNNCKYEKDLLSNLFPNSNNLNTLSFGLPSKPANFDNSAQNFSQQNYPQQNNPSSDLQKKRQQFRQKLKNEQKQSLRKQIRTERMQQFLQESYWQKYCQNALSQQIKEEKMYQQMAQQSQIETEQFWSSFQNQQHQYTHSKDNDVII